MTELLYKDALLKVKPPEALAPCKDGTIFLGANNLSSMVRFMNYYQSMVDAGMKAPLGLLSKLIAERISNPHDRQDMLVGVFSARGMGKSRFALYLCWAVSQQLSKITGKPAEYYFTGRNVISLADGPLIAQRLAEIPDCSCVVIDDAGVGINSRDFQSKSSKGILKIISTCRTKRLLLVATAPASTHIDVAMRQMLALEIRVHKACHAFGYNVVKVNRTSLGIWGKEYRSQIVGDAGKITYWIAPNAPDHIVKEYDDERNQSARDLEQDVSKKLNPGTEKVKRDAAYNREQAFIKHGDKVRDVLKQNPEISAYKLGMILGVHNTVSSYLLERIRGETNGR